MNESWKLNQLLGTSKATKYFLSQGINNFYDAVIYINRLTYGRNSQRDDYFLVLKENCGTCSTKHAILKALALEQNIDINLKLGLFLMNETNMPIISNVLKNFGLDAIPEAHCFLQLDKQKFDITFPGKISNLDTIDFLFEENIEPNQIGEYKIQFHQKFIKEWLKKEALNVSFDYVWDCREKCINALSH